MIETIGKQGGQTGEQEQEAAYTVPKHEHTKPPLSKIMPYWSMIITALTTRHLFESANRIFRPFSEALENNRLTGLAKFGAANFYSLTFGSLIAGATAFYAKWDMDAVKTLYSDAVAMETGKNPTEVTYQDIFKSKNTVVAESLKEIRSKNLTAGAIVSTFFAPWHLLSREKQKPVNIQARVGSGFLGVFLLSHSSNAKFSTMEALQNLIDSKLHHNRSSETPYDIITANEIGNLTHSHKAKLNPTWHPPTPDSLEGQQDKFLSALIAESLNATYRNIPGKHSHFSLGKMLYLMGNSPDGTKKSYLDQEYPLNAAYVKLAAQAEIEVIVRVSNAIKQGVNPKAAFEEYGIALEGIKTIPFEPPAREHESSFSKGMSPVTNHTQLAEKMAGASHSR